MSAVVEVWVSELARLKEKVKKVRKPLLSKSRDKKEEEEEEVVVGGRIKANKEDSKLGHVHGDTTTISETTVFLLMDRFAPL